MRRLSCTELNNLFQGHRSNVRGGIWTGSLAQSLGIACQKHNFIAWKKLITSPSNHPNKSSSSNSNSNSKAEHTQTLSKTWAISEDCHQPPQTLSQQPLGIFSSLPTHTASLSYPVSVRSSLIFLSEPCPYFSFSPSEHSCPPISSHTFFLTS